MTPRRRLFRKYVVLFGALVSGALLASGGLDLYFSYHEHKDALAAVQREKAAGAAVRIEQFVREIERQLGWTTHPPVATGAAAIEQRRLDAFRLQRQVPAITELSYLDATGREQLRVSRLAMDVAGSGEDFSADPRFTTPRPGAPYFSPVYFRKESEPYMTVAMAGTAGSPGVTVAEVNLKFIWDVISQIRIGEAGQAYVVDARGHLIAHPDISLVLKKTDLSHLPQVQAARGALADARRPGQAVLIERDLQGRQVLTAFAPIPALGWVVFAEQPQVEAFAPLRAALHRTALLLVLGIGLAVLASLVVARRMVTPIQALHAGAARIAEGELGHRLEVRTGDELEALADQFNRMAAELQESYAGLERKVEARTQELSVALEQQTATAEILRVISRSPTDVHPVFDTIARSATRLCNGLFGGVFLRRGDTVDLVADCNFTPEGLAAFRRLYPMSVDAESNTTRALRERRPVHIVDTQTDPSVAPGSRALAHALGFRSLIMVPILREGFAVGVIGVSRSDVKPFSEQEIALLKTFADQAVIAIENVRLFQELQTRTRELARKVEELTALGEVSRAVSATLDLERVLDTIVSRARALAGGDGCSIYEYDEGAQFVLRATAGLEAELVEVARATPLGTEQGAVGQLAVTRAPVEIPDIAEPGAYQGRLREALVRWGHRAVLALPLLREDELIGGLVVTRKTPGGFAPEVVGVLQTFATQSALALQNARLFRELEDKSRQLEIANRHKSEFLANMSHELRTPLNAVIGFSEVLQQRMFGDLNEKQAEYLEDIVASGRHLLSLINDILDLSKVEAGRMELDLARFSLPAALDNAVTLVRERATRHGVALELATDPRVGEVVADERKVKQILLNLLSNAIKFTPEGGQVTVRAVPADGAVEVAVGDTGIGIAPADQALIFEEFRQVGGDYARKREGTGLGLALVRRFVQLHGGQIWVKSAVGEGSTFAFTLPGRPWPAS
jgi:signal transduction histidine kinase/HAMP domain-containing protein